MESRDVFFTVALYTFKGCLAVSHKVSCRGGAPKANALLLEKGFAIFKGLVSEATVLLERVRLVVDGTLPVRILDSPAFAVCLRTCQCVRYFGLVHGDMRA